MDKIKRWYDVNEKVSILMSHLEKSPELKQKFVAKKITQMARSKNIIINEIPSEYLRKLRRRWYDNDETVCLAIEHLKIAPPILQTRIAEKILLNINKIDDYIMKQLDTNGNV